MFTTSVIVVDPTLTVISSTNAAMDEQFLNTVLADGATDEKFQICQELFNTERHYIDNLKLLLKVKDALMERVEKEKPIISKPKIVQIFGKIQPIVDLHEEISQKLADLIENWNENKCDVAKIWVDANNELLRVYPSYINYCDDARCLLIDAYERHPRLRAFIEMKFPVLELEKKSTGGSTELHTAIEGVGNVLRRSNSVRRENDVHIAQLNLLQEVEDIPCEVVYASHVVIGAVEVQLLCATNKIKLGSKDSALRLTLFSDECNYRLKRSPVCCWKIRERMCDIDWFVAVENMEDMDHFAGALEGMIGGRMGRKLNLHTEMRFWEVPNECRSVVKKFLVTKKFVVSENDCESEQAAFVGSLFNGMSSIKKSKERTKPTRDYNRRHTIEPCEINFAPITEEN
ncbi:hypothetical protein ANCCEY_13060 [Ancylostoma ceylanicum]|uniref:DH domain-containing protein n=1 Tax=Ancylostoma ceylanicum TaxID=53326 RepID=A0A0D6LDC1_9BILA|nr:hypothetical protein ANCCEY_13060 [Ancylostoma ceylanicum]